MSKVNPDHGESSEFNSLKFVSQKKGWYSSGLVCRNPRRTLILGNYYIIAVLYYNEVSRWSLVAGHNAVNQCGCNLGLC